MKDYICDSIARILSGEKGADSTKLDEWMDEKKSNRVIFNAFKFHWSNGNSKTDSGSEVFQRVLHRIEGSAVKPLKMTNKKPFWGYYSRVASVLLLGVGLAWGLHHFLQVETEPGISDADEYIEKATQKGQKTTVRLMDGTVVKLNSDSRIKYPFQFTDHGREVILEGEAFFEVTRDENRPFTVRSGDVVTKVLGTSFNIKAKPDDSEINVAVVSGKVSVKSTLNSKGGKSVQGVILEPNEMAIYDKNNDGIQKGKFEAQVVLGWKEGVLVLKNANLNQIKRSLEDWYGITVQYTNIKAEGVDVTANYHNEPLRNVLESLNHTLRFEYQIDDKNIQIKFLNP